ncbi:hypothetical protein EVAR_51451_1 [Eumeta japonica]|uniref:DUF4200 domain-containing protein n=1 Tax=Eumeta variegata TaxID=151549 RepID=A0A4C1XWE6_EUMVA|nr:hypothetical protein EVAR_51451_1 [Eumeta japonica]
MDRNQKQRKNRSASKFGIKLPPIEGKVENFKVKTVMDIDPDFFTLVDGRSIRPNKSLSVYKGNIRDLMLKRTLRGYTEDEILRIDRQNKAETEIHERAVIHFEEYKTSFDKFLADNNNVTINIMRKSDGLARDLANKTEEHRKITFEMTNLKSKLQYVDETIMILLSFERFLHRISPGKWQKDNNVDLAIQQKPIFTIGSNIFQQLNTDSIKEQLNALQPPRLYFETPEQLTEIFSVLETQNLEYLLKAEEMRVLLLKFLRALDRFKENLKHELDFVQEKVKDVEELILWNVQRESELKKMFYKILEEKIRYLVSSKAVLELHNHVEYAYEQLISKNDTDQSTLSMILSVESEYNNLMLELSTVHPKIVKAVEKETFENDAKQLQKAKISHDLLKNVDKISRRLKASYEPYEKHDY